MAKKVVCSKCKVNKNVSGTGGFCRECATSKGFKSCSRCNKMFTPRASRQKPKISSFYKGETVIYGDLTHAYSLVLGASLSSIL
jgi:hypothetical protein